MCLSIPGKVVFISGEEAKVSIGGSFVNASLQLLDGVKEGDYVIVHSGFALQKISEQEAKKTFDLFKELKQFNDQLDREEGR